MKLLKLTLIVVAFPISLSANVYFPLNKGDMWIYENRNSIICEGTVIASTVFRDTTLDGQPYAVLLGSVFGGPYVRCDSNRVFIYDTTLHVEYVVFDFSAKAGDTINVRENGNSIMIALGSLMFVKHNSSSGDVQFTIRDSVGVISVTNPVCPLYLTSAFIQGKKVYPTGVTLNINPVVPADCYLEQNYPNPFNSSTTIRFFLPIEQQVTLDILNNIGQVTTTLLKGKMGAGWYQSTWQSDNQASGIYYFRLRSGSATITRSALLIK
jgi:hypothetical protein